MSFQVKKKIDLQFLGEGWNDCYVNVSPLSWEEDSEMTKIRARVANIETEEQAEAEKKKMTQILVEHFIDGKGWDGTKQVDITKKNVTKLPTEAITKILREMQGLTITPN